MSERLSPSERIRLTKLRIASLEVNRAGYTKQGDLTRAWNSAWSCLFEAESDLKREKLRA